MVSLRTRLGQDSGLPDRLVLSGPNPGGLSLTGAYAAEGLSVNTMWEGEQPLEFDFEEVAAELGEAPASGPAVLVDFTPLAAADITGAPLIRPGALAVSGTYATTMAFSVWHLGPWGIPTSRVDVTLTAEGRAGAGGVNAVGVAAQWAATLQTLGFNATAAGGTVEMSGWWASGNGQHGFITGVTMNVPYAYGTNGAGLDTGILTPSATPAP